MSSSTTHITGYDINAIHPYEPFLTYAGIFLALPIYSIGIFAWCIVFLAIRKARLLDDPNYILIISLGCADMLLLVVAFTMGLMGMTVNGYSNGFYGMPTNCNYI